MPLHCIKAIWTTFGPTPYRDPSKKAVALMEDKYVEIKNIATSIAMFLFTHS